MDTNNIYYAKCYVCKWIEDSLPNPQVAQDVSYKHDEEKHNKKPVSICGNISAVIVDRFSDRFIARCMYSPP